MQEISLDVIFSTIFTISGSRREGICKFMGDTMLEFARILGEIVRIQNVVEKYSEINQVEFCNKVITASTNYSHQERKSRM